MSFLDTNNIKNKISFKAVFLFANNTYFTLANFQRKNNNFDSQSGFG